MEYRIFLKGAACTLLTFAAVACSDGGGGDSNGGPSGPAADSFFSEVKALVATSPDDTEPREVDSITATSPEDTEPTSLDG